MRDVWNQLNHRLLKWVKWEKGLCKYASLRWLRAQNGRNPGLFAHWSGVWWTLGFRHERQKCNKVGLGPDANAVRVLQRFLRA